MNFTTCMLITAGGVLGTLARYVVSVWALPISHDLPWGTMIINISGSFINGVFGTLALAHGRFPMSEIVRLFVMIGLCGGFTTYSSFSLQTLDLMRNGAMLRAAVNILASVTLCLLAVALGHAIASRLNGGAIQIA